MSRAAVDDLAAVKKLMPGLRRLALFASKSIAIVSTETGIELDDLDAWVKAHGRPSASAIEDLEDKLAGVDTSPGAARADDDLEPPAPEPPPRRFLRPIDKLAKDTGLSKPDILAAAADALNDVITVVEPTKAVPVAPTPAPMKAKTTNARNSDPERWRNVVKALLDNQDTPELETVRKAGIPIGSWGGFKKRTFGLGPIPPVKLKGFLKGAAPAEAVEKKTNSAPNRRDPPPISYASPTIGCSVCRAFTVHVVVRGKVAEVCPTCLAEREQGVLERTLALAEFVTPKPLAEQ
jgi:hypothetical protein